MTEVWKNNEYLGKVLITEEDWRKATNWRQAALAAARRVFGPGIYHVVEQSYVCGELI